MQETDSGDLLQFHQQATTFNLNVVLVGKKLKITLQDFTQWLLYSREYTQQDIGDEIHKKVDLTDLYFSLVYSQGQKVKNSDQKNEQEKQCIKEYSFGQIIKRGQRKCYDITKGGKLRIYCIGYDHKNGQQIYHESKLQLTKIRQLNEIQIITEKFLLEKRQHTKKFQRQLQKIKIQNKKLQQCYIQVKIQNKKMEQKLKHTQQQNQETKQQIKILKQQQMKTNQQFKQNKQALKQCMKQLEKYKTSLTPITEKLNQYNPKIQALQTAVKKYKEQGFNSLYIFSLPQTYSNKFNIYSNRIQFLENNTWTQYVFNQKIPYNCDYVFKIKIIKTSARNIMIGVVDYPKQKNARSSYNNPNSLCYYGVNGYKYPLSQTQGGGYSQGQTVQINVNLTNKTVKWLVSGSQRATGTQDSLADQTRSYYPFIQLYNKNDIVAWSFE